MWRGISHHCSASVSQEGNKHNDFQVQKCQTCKGIMTSERDKFGLFPAHIFTRSSQLEINFSEMFGFWKSARSCLSAQRWGQHAFAGSTFAHQAPSNVPESLNKPLASQQLNNTDLQTDFKRISRYAEVILLFFLLQYRFHKEQTCTSTLARSNATRTQGKTSVQTKRELCRNNTLANVSDTNPISPCHMESRISTKSRFQRTYGHLACMCSVWCRRVDSITTVPTPLHTPGPQPFSPQVERQRYLEPLLAKMWK